MLMKEINSNHMHNRLEVETTTNLNGQIKQIRIKRAGEAER